MRNFIYKFSLFVLIPIVIAFPIDIIISDVLKTTNIFPNENEVWNDIYESKINANIAIFGSSRAWVNFDTKIIENSLHTNSYNFGEDGSNIMLQYLRYKEYISHNPQPKIVILSLDHISLEKRNNGYPSVRYYPYMLFNTRIVNILQTYNQNINKPYFFIPIIRYLHAPKLIMNIFNSNKKPYSDTFEKYFELNEEGKLRYHGYRGMDLKWNTNIDSLKQRKATIDSTLLTVLSDFINELKSKDIIVFLVYTPEYIEGQKIIMNKAEVISKYIYLSEKYNIPFYDYSNNWISRDKNFFYNVLHLNKLGAQTFTKQFINDTRLTVDN